MLFNITFLLFTILGRASSTNTTSQDLILYNETKIVDERNLKFKKLRKIVNAKNLGKVLKVAGTVAKIGGTINPALKGISAGISVAQKLLAAREKLKKLETLKKAAKSVKNIKNLNSKISKVRSVISKDKKLLAASKRKKITTTKVKKITTKGKKITTTKGKPKGKTKSKKITTKGKRKGPTGGEIIPLDSSIPTEFPTDSPNGLLPTIIKVLKRKRPTKTKATDDSTITPAPKQRQVQRPSITDDSRPTPASRPRQVQRPSITDDSIRQRQRTQSPSFAKTMDDSVPTPVPRAKIRRTRKPSLMDDSIPTPVPRARIRRTQEPSLMDDSIPTPIFRLRGTKQPFIAKITDDSTFTPSILKQPTRIQRSKINAPTITLWPSHKPSLLPTQAPSQKPSQTPGLLPSQKPSSIPTQKPSLIPSSNPTPIPSLKPTPIPSSAPTDYIPCNKNCPVKPNLCGFYETCGNGCWCGRFPPTPSSFPTLTPTQNLFIIAPPTMMPYTGAVSISLSPMPTLQPSSKSTQMPTTFLPTTISPTTTRPTIRLSESPTLPPPTQLPMQLQTQLPTLFPSPLPTLDQTSTILSSNGASNNSSASSNTIIASAVVGSVILLLIAIVIIYCLVRKNKKLDAFTKWRMHYDVQTPIRRDTPATIENDIHHFYKRNPSVYNKEFTPYVSKSQRSSQRNSLKPQPMSIDYNRNSIRL